MALECFSLRNPSPIVRGQIALTTPPIPRFSSQFSRRSHSPAVSFSYIPRGIRGSPLKNRRSFQLACADTNPSETEPEEERSELVEQGNELAALGKELTALGTALSYHVMVKVKNVLEESISQAAATHPEPVKEVFETIASSTKNAEHISEIPDFYIGVPYGAILSLGGFLNFMITGNTSAIRFGVILGGILLALSVSSLTSWRKGEPTDSLILKCETAIAGILFLRHLLLFFKQISFPVLISICCTTISGLVAAFFIYRLILFRLAAKKTT